MSYFHITSPQNVDKILKEGIKANAGEIYLFDSEDIAHPFEEGKFINVAKSIARNQCGLERYIVLEIDESGITGELVPEGVGELTASVQWILKQEIILPEFLIDSWDESYYEQE